MWKRMFKGSIIWHRYLWLSKIKIFENNIISVIIIIFIYNYFLKGNKKCVAQQIASYKRRIKNVPLNGKRVSSWFIQKEGSRRYLRRIF